MKEAPYRSVAKFLMDLSHAKNKQQIDLAIKKLIEKLQQNEADVPSLSKAGKPS